MDALFYLIIIALAPIIFPIIVKKTLGWDAKVDLTGHGLTGRMGQVRTTIPNQISVNREAIEKTYAKLEQDVLNKRITKANESLTINAFITELNIAKLDLEINEPEGYIPKKKMIKDIEFLNKYIIKTQELKEKVVPFKYPDFNLKLDKK